MYQIKLFLWRLSNAVGGRLLKTLHPRDRQFRSGLIRL